MTAQHAPDKPAPNVPLEGLRGVACLLVALGHVLYLTHLDPTVTLPVWMPTLEAAHNAVLIFFVLSGYLISWTNSGVCNGPNLQRYVRRRIIRLAPVYYVALGLTVAVIIFCNYPGQLRSIAATALGVQNFNDYFGLHLPPPMSNGPLWSLNYELVYYAAFVVLWRFQPRAAWVFLPALGLSGLTWFFPHVMPLFLGSYASGWIFWAAGWWLARQPALGTGTPNPPALSWLLLVYVGHQIGGATRILNALGWHCPDGGMVTLGDLGSLPAVLLLLAAVARRQVPGARLWAAAAWFLGVVPVAGMVWTGRLWTNPGWEAGTIALILAAVALPWRSLAWLGAFAWLGSVSYAFYVVHFPFLFLVQRAPLPAGSVGAYFLRIGVWAGLSLGLAWWLDLRFQPWIKKQLNRQGESG